MEFTDIPNKPGVYLFMDSSYSVIYVGKAKFINKRVRSHFGRDNLDSKHISMISQVRTVDYITTDNEKEALILEDQLIKNLEPRYNIALKDDKSYPYLEVTTSNQYPALKITRNRKNADSVYFGPFPNVSDIRAAKKVIDRIFILRKCKKFKMRERPCLNYQMARCLSPCTGQIDEVTYSEIVDEIIMFLSGKQRKLITRLETKMDYFKQKQEYEKAAAVRDQIHKLKNFFPMVSFRRITRKKLEALNKIDPLYFLKEILNMEHKPGVIEGFDISHTSAQEAVGSMVYFRNGKPDKNNYRKFKIKQEETADDLKMIQEVVFRRLKRLLKENKRLPDIILIDGGKGQALAARAIVDEFKLTNIKVLSLAKEQGNVYYNGKILKIDKDSEVLNLLKRITDEAHNFAHSYHTQRRKRITGINN